LEQIESFIANIASSNDPQKLIDTANQIAKITTIPLDNIGDQIKRQQEEIRTVNDEIEKAGAVLKKMNVDIQTIDEYKNLKEKLERSGLSMESLHELVSVLPKFNRMGSNPQKIVAYYAHMKSLEKKEWRLKNYCKMWESRAAEYQKIIPMCKHVVSMGIDFPLLLTLETAVIKKVEEEHIPPESAPFQVMQEIEYYNRNGGIKKQLYDTTLQVGMVKEILGRQNNAINTFMKLQISGMTEAQILNLCKTIEASAAILNVNYDIMITRLSPCKRVRSKRRLGLLCCISTY
jgi:hypothetical protein